MRFAISTDATKCDRLTRKKEAGESSMGVVAGLDSPFIRGTEDQKAARKLSRGAAENWPSTASPSSVNALRARLPQSGVCIQTAPPAVARRTWPLECMTRRSSSYSSASESSRSLAAAGTTATASSESPQAISSFRIISFSSADEITL